MEGWFKEQREQHARQIEFMHLDALVDWIAEHRLVNELRVALQEQGIHAVDLPSMTGADVDRTSPMRRRR